MCTIDLLDNFVFVVHRKAYHFLFFGLLWRTFKIFPLHVSDRAAYLSSQKMLYTAGGHPRDRGTNSDWFLYFLIAPRPVINLRPIGREIEIGSIQKPPTRPYNRFCVHESPEISSNPVLWRGRWGFLPPLDRLPHLDCFKTKRNMLKVW